MLKILIVALAVVGVALVVVLVLASTKPASFHVERSTDIAATPARVAGFINDFHQWDAWSPWAKLDPGMRTTYGGPASGPGATYAWEGNRKVGKGRMEILFPKRLLQRPSSSTFSAPLKATPSPPSTSRPKAAAPVSPGPWTAQIPLWAK